MNAMARENRKIALKQSGMIRKRPVPHLLRDGYRLSLATTRSVCAEIMRKQSSMIPEKWEPVFR